MTLLDTYHQVKETQSLIRDRIELVKRRKETHEKMCQAFINMFGYEPTDIALQAFKEMASYYKNNFTFTTNKAV